MSFSLSVYESNKTIDPPPGQSLASISYARVCRWPSSLHANFRSVGNFLGRR